MRNHRPQNERTTANLPQVRAYKKLYIKYEVAPVDPHHRVMGCQCSCKRRNWVEVPLLELEIGAAISCGCLKRNPKHGGSRHPLHKTWENVRAKCKNPKHPQFHTYEGKLCKEWHDPTNFLRYIATELGPLPLGSSLRPKDIALGFTPGNVEWVPTRRTIGGSYPTRKITWRGEARTITDWATAFGIAPSLLRARVCRLGWPMERALNTPKNHKSPTGGDNSFFG